MYICLHIYIYIYIYIYACICTYIPETICLLHIRMQKRALYYVKKTKKKKFIWKLKFHAGEPTIFSQYILLLFYINIICVFEKHAKGDFYISVKDTGSVVERN